MKRLLGIHITPPDLAVVPPKTSFFKNDDRFTGLAHQQPGTHRTRAAAHHHPIEGFIKTGHLASLPWRIRFAC